MFNGNKMNSAAEPVGYRLQFSVLEVEREVIYFWKMFKDMLRFDYCFGLKIIRYWRYVSNQNQEGESGS